MLLPCLSDGQISEECVSYCTKAHLLPHQVKTKRMIYYRELVRSCLASYWVTRTTWATTNWKWSEVLSYVTHFTQEKFLVTFFGLTTINVNSQLDLDSARNTLPICHAPLEKDKLSASPSWERSLEITSDCWQPVVGETGIWEALQNKSFKLTSDTVIANCFLMFNPNKSNASSYASLSKTGGSIVNSDPNGGFSFLFDLGQSLIGRIIQRAIFMGLLFLFLSSLNYMQN